MSPRVKDHEGNDVTYGRETVNGVRLDTVWPWSAPRSWPASCSASSVSSHLVS